MKKIILSALIAVSLISSAFASGTTKVSVVIRNSFKSQFGNVQNVEWNSTDAYVTANFVLDNTKMQAFYDFSGGFIGTSHAITSDELPAKAKRAFAKKYADYTVKEAIKFEKSDETSYFIAASKDNASVILKVSEGQVSRVK